MLQCLSLWGKRVVRDDRVVSKNAGDNSAATPLLNTSEASGVSASEYDY